MNTVNTVHTVDTATVVARRRYFPAINWGAIIAGIVVGMATQLVLALLGIAAGLSVIDAAVGEPGAPANAPIWAAVWHGVTMLIAAFVGGYVAARMSGLQRNGDGILHGLVAWGATTLLVASLAASALGALFGGVMPLLTQGVTRGATESADVRGATTGTQLEDLIRREVPGDAGTGSADSANMAAVFRHVRAGEREPAIDLLQSMGLPPDRAAAVVDQALALSGSPAASPGAREGVEEGVETASATSWWVFAAVALSMLLGIGGGLAGAASSQRTRHGHHDDHRMAAAT